jgi:hypothetical protein
MQAATTASASCCSGTDWQPRRRAGADPSRSGSPRLGTLRSPKPADEDQGFWSELLLQPPSCAASAVPESSCSSCPPLALCQRQLIRTAWRSRPCAANEQSCSRPSGSLSLALHQQQLHRAAPAAPALRCDRTKLLQQPLSRATPAATDPQLFQHPLARAYPAASDTSCPVSHSIAKPLNEH